jgi:hypothetical protein
MQKKGAALRAAQEQDSRDRLHPSGARHAPGMAAPESPTAPAQGKEVAPRPPLLDFAPVPRRYRHDGWTPERQRAFIAALADTGVVDRAARMVNMAQANCYALRRAPGAEEFARAWEAALDCGLLVMKDMAFERAIEGELIPVFSQGKLMGYRRKHNDALLMFCLRHYGQDANGKRVTVNYFSTRASAGAGAPEGEDKGAGAEASTTSVRTVISGSGGVDAAARTAEAVAVLNGFEGVALDAEAEAAIARALEECAERARAADAAYEEGGAAAAAAAADDPGEPFFRSGDYHGALIPPCVIEDFEPFAEGEPHWSLAGAERPEMLIQWEEEQARKKAAGAEAPEPSRE